MRLAAQHGRLTASDNATVDAQLLWRLATLRHGNERTGQSFGRHIIRASCKRDILRFLSEEKGVVRNLCFQTSLALGDSYDGSLRRYV